MNKKFININIFYLILVILFSFFFNYFYANLGVFPIDTFAFLDTAYNIHLNRHPFKDIWVTTGPLVDYLQFFFFNSLIVGNMLLILVMSVTAPLIVGKLRSALK